MSTITGQLSIWSTHLTPERAAEARYAPPVANAPRRAAELLVQCLEHEGVACVFGIPGEENIYLTDALSRSTIRYVLVRHEQAASFMAEIHGRLTGRAGVCSATLGPGAINLLLGTADAHTNSTPVLALSAQVGLNRIYKESHQSVDLVSMFSPVTKWADLVLTPGSIPEMVRKAFKLAQTERPGSVYLGVPEDVEAAFVSDQLVPLDVNTPRTDEPSPSQIARAAAVLDASQRPIILAGHGAARSGAADALLRFSELLGLPVATTFHGKGVFPDDHPHSLGAVGFMSHDYVKFRVRRCRRHRQRRVRTAGVRPRPDQPGRRQANHPPEPRPGGSGLPIRRRRWDPG